jgi:hypothetical protein
MERRSQARTKVDINALLIGEKTVPKGCRVISVSQNGMQLQCHDDGRLLTFKNGDSVDVYLTIQHDGRRKKLTIPSWVRQVSTNGIDVEFHKQDSALVDLIESYRNSEHHRIEASLGRADRRAGGHQSAPPGAGGQTAARTAEQEQKPPVRPFYSILLATVFIACIITGGYVYTASIDSRISTLESLSKRQATELSEVQNRIFSASLQEGRYASLNARMTALNDAFVNLEKRLDGVLPPVASRAAPGAAPEARPTIPPPSAPPTETGTRILQADTRAADTATVSVPGPVHQRDDQPASLVASNTGTGTTDIPASPPAEQATEVPEPAAPAEPVQQTTPAAGPKTAPTGKNASSGPWVINLISSTDRAYVERFSRERDATRFNAVVNEARVRGRRYWRLQITGFESAAAARRQAAIVKQELGIKDVWIFRE